MSYLKIRNREGGEQEMIQEMIIEAQCCVCDQHIGYLSITGDTELLKDTKYVKKISHRSDSIKFLCDKCRDRWVDLVGELE